MSLQYDYDLLVKVKDNNYAPQKHITISANTRSEAKDIAKAQGYKVISVVGKA